MPHLGQHAMWKPYRTGKKRHAQQEPERHRQRHQDLARPARHRPDSTGITPGEPHTYGTQNHTEITGGQVKNALVLVMHFF